MDNSKTLDDVELKLVLQSKTLGLNLSEDEIAGIIQLAEKDGDGQVPYEEFVPMLKRILMQIYAAALPFVCIELFVLALLILFPSVALWLPSFIK